MANTAVRVARLATMTAALVAAMSAGAAWAAPMAADFILHHAKVWTVDDARPEAEAVAVRGGKIVKVGSNDEVLRLKGPKTIVLDAEGKRVLPGFNDSHTHFGNAVDWFFQARLTDVNDQALLEKRIQEVTARVPKGMWITGGDFAASAASKAAKETKEAKTDFHALVPDLKAVDAISPDHPLIFRRYDHVYFANSKALQMARLTKNSPDPTGGSYGHDPVTGELNGMLYGTAGEILERQLPPVSLQQRLIGARGVERDLNRVGITSITDIAHIDDISEEKIYSSYVERSATDMRIFNGLKKNGELTVRVYAMLPIETVGELAKHKIKPGSGDEWVRYGGVKSYGDSGVMFRPFKGTGLPNEWSFRFAGHDLLEKQILAADRAGFDVGVHIIGDKATNFLINAYAEAARVNPPRDRRNRLIHVWHSTPEDIRLAGSLGLAADVQPYHLGREVATMDKGLDEERARSAHAWRSLIDAGVRLNLGSDLPGSYNKLHIAPYNPMENIYYAVTRMDKKGYPEGGWHPEQRITVKEAIKGYTLNPAWSSHEEKIKGSISEGKVADMVVLSNDILNSSPQEILTTKVLHTILGGRVLDTGN